MQRVAVVAVVVIFQIIQEGAVEGGLEIMSQIKHEMVVVVEVVEVVM